MGTNSFVLHTNTAKISSLIRNIADGNNFNNKMLNIDTIFDYKTNLLINVITEVSDVFFKCNHSELEDGKMYR